MYLTICTYRQVRQFKSVSSSPCAKSVPSSTYRQVRIIRQVRQAIGQRRLLSIGHEVQFVGIKKHRNPRGSQTKI